MQLSSKHGALLESIPRNNYSPSKSPIRDVSRSPLRSNFEYNAYKS